MPTPNLILALDQGTTSSRAILFDQSGQPRAIAQREVRQIYPQPGHVEHDPADIWTTQLATASEVLEKADVSVHDLAAIGITNQRETTLLWDRATGQPLHNAIVWQDRRTADLCDSLKKAGHAPTIQEKTGLVIDAYFSASKLQWLLDHIPHARTRAAHGELAFGTIDSWLLWNLTKGCGEPTKPGLHVTDISNASRTMLLNIHTGQWDAELLQLFNIPPEILPEICNSSGTIAETHPSLLGRAIPITGIAGDQQAALFGQACYSHGLAKNTYGTGCFMLMNIGDKPLPSKNQLLTTIAWSLPSESSSTQSKIKNQKSKITYALEGSVFIGGAVVQWLRDGLGLVKSAAEVEQLARSVPDNGGVYLVPAFAGLGAPHWDQFARGIIAGITRGTSAGHIARAALEAIAFQVADILEVMHADSGIPIRQLRVDGGATANNLLMQFQADLLQVPVIRPTVTETTALGAAMLAGLGVGLWKDPNEVAQRWQVEREFLPQMKPDEVAQRRARWNSALARARDWEQPA